MSDLLHDDPVLGRCVVTFDGRILELFTATGVNSARMIVSMLHVDVAEPNRKGRREVTFSTAPNSRGDGFRLWVPAEQWEGVAPFVTEIEGALALVKGVR